MGRADGGSARIGVVLAAALGAALLTGASPAMAQDGSTSDGAPEAQAAPVDSLLQEGDIEYRRATFDYPQRDRNPFEPVSAGVEEGPRFQNLLLSGVIYSPSIGSVAVLLDQSTGERFRVREGERIGQATVLSIRRSNVMFSVAGPTRSRQETLQVEKQNEEVQR